MKKVHLYHYFDKTVGAFVSLSDISVLEAIAILDTIKETKPSTQSAKRHATYVEDRRYVGNCR